MDLLELSKTTKSWPFQEARNIKPKGDTVIFETGYGPSGLPHLGTFAEVLRTTMVRKAFETMNPGVKTKLICFSDDMDALRSVPDNVPNQEMLKEHIGMPLTKVPDPFGVYESFAHHNNAKLQKFLDSFGFDYEFISATDMYKSGAFNNVLSNVLKNYPQILEIMLKNLGEERRLTYSPIMPICRHTGKVLMDVSMSEIDPDRGTVCFVHPEHGMREEVSVFDGNCKLQWKVDWAARWAHFGVDYEMSGKDLSESVSLSRRICKTLGQKPPVGFSYELFLDQNGEKISKSRGNGMSIEEWLRYASHQTLSLFLYKDPRSAKRLHFDVIPKHVDLYQSLLKNYVNKNGNILDNPLWHMHGGKSALQLNDSVSFQLLLNLVNATNAENKDILWLYLSTYVKGISSDNCPDIDELVQYAVNYYHDFIKPNKKYKKPDDNEIVILANLSHRLQQLPEDVDSAGIQQVIYDVGKKSTLEMKDWFKSLYQILLGQEQGPRLGSFIKCYGIPETVRLINEKTQV